MSENPTVSIKCVSCLLSPCEMLIPLAWSGVYGAGISRLGEQLRYWDLELDREPFDMQNAPLRAPRGFRRASGVFKL